MAFSECITNQFRQDSFNGIHQPSDTYKIALYIQSAAPTLNKSLTAYTNAGELETGSGYTRDSKVLTGFTVGLSGDVAYIDFDDPSWLMASITADAALIYNSSRANKAMVVLAFPRATSTAGPFTVYLPAPGASAVITSS